MNEIEKILFALGFLSCFEMYASQDPNHPEQAGIKRLYVQERYFVDIVFHTPREEIYRLIDDINREKPHEVIVNLMKKKMDHDGMINALKNGKFTSLDDIR